MPKIRKLNERLRLHLDELHRAEYITQIIASPGDLKHSTRPNVWLNAGKPDFKIVSQHLTGSVKFAYLLTIQPKFWPLADGVRERRAMFATKHNPGAFGILSPGKFGSWNCRWLTDNRLPALERLHDCDLKAWLSAA